MCNLGPSALWMSVFCSHLLMQSLAFRDKKNTFSFALHSKLFHIPDLLLDDGHLFTPTSLPFPSPQA